MTGNLNINNKLDSLPGRQTLLFEFQNIQIQFHFFIYIKYINKISGTNSKQKSGDIKVKMKLK